LDGSPIHIIKIKMVQVRGRHFRVSFLFSKIKEDKFSMDYCYAYIDKVHQYMYVHEYV